MNLQTVLSCKKDAKICIYIINNKINEGINLENYIDLVDELSDEVDDLKVVCSRTGISIEEGKYKENRKQLLDNLVGIGKKLKRIQPNKISTDETYENVFNLKDEFRIYYKNAGLYAKENDDELNKKHEAERKNGTALSELFKSENSCKKRVELLKLISDLIENIDVFYNYLCNISEFDDSGKYLESIASCDKYMVYFKYINKLIYALEKYIEIERKSGKYLTSNYTFNVGKVIDNMKPATDILKK